MKKFVLFAFVGLLLNSSCAVNRMNERVVVFKNDGGGPNLFSSTFLVFKSSGWYDLFLSDRNDGGIGRYTIVNDTLRLYPQYTYASRIRELSDEEKELNPMPNVFLKRGKELIDITDYSIYNSLISPHSLMSGAVYRLME